MKGAVIVLGCEVDRPSRAFSEATLGAVIVAYWFLIAWLIASGVKVGVCPRIATATVSCCREYEDFSVYKMNSFSIDAQYDCVSSLLLMNGVPSCDPWLLESDDSVGSSPLCWLLKTDFPAGIPPLYVCS